MNTDPIADYLTRIRNAVKAGHGLVEIPLSGIKKEITRVLHDQGYIVDYVCEEEVGKSGTIKIVLKYDAKTKESAIVKLQRVSKPGLRKYFGCSQLPEVINGLGIAVVSTSKGVMSNKEAKKMNVGGEVLCYVY